MRKANRYIRTVNGQLSWVVPQTIKRENPKTPISKATDKTMAQFGRAGNTRSSAA